MNKLIVKNTTKSSTNATTITIKVPADFKTQWDHFCIENNVNKSKTLVATLQDIMKDN